MYFMTFHNDHNNERSAFRCCLGLLLTTSSRSRFETKLDLDRSFTTC